MLTLIAESKKMSMDMSPVPLSEFKQSEPLFEEKADELALFFASLTPNEIASCIGLSFTYAVRGAYLFMNFLDKSIGYTAIDGFTGEVFKAFDFHSLPPESQDAARKKVIIISSLYGFLRPDDIIRPYRLDFKCLSPDGMELCKMWKSHVTIALASHLKETGEKEILDLLPAEASRCIDWKVIKAFAKVERVDFKQISENERLKTPPSGRLKQLRGLMLREVITGGVTKLSQLKDVATNDFTYYQEGSKKGLPMFLC